MDLKLYPDSREYIPNSPLNPCLSVNPDADKQIQMKRRNYMKKNNNKGFTLAELLIVVAIIAVLVAIAIPVFTSQLEKSRESVDASDIRSYYAEITTSMMTMDPKTGGTIQVGGTKSVTIQPWANQTSVEVTVGWKAHQTQTNWQSGDVVVAGVTIGKDTDFSTATGIKYTYAFDTDGDMYLSAVAPGAATP